MAFVGGMYWRVSSTSYRSRIFRSPLGKLGSIIGILVNNSWHQERRHLFHSRLPRLNRIRDTRETNSREDQLFDLIRILSCSLRMQYSCCSHLFDIQIHIEIKQKSSPSCCRSINYSFDWIIQNYVNFFN